MPCAFPAGSGKVQSSPALHGNGEPAAAGSLCRQRTEYTVHGARTTLVGRPREGPKTPTPRAPANRWRRVLAASWRRFGQRREGTPGALRTDPPLLSGAVHRIAPGYVITPVEDPWNSPLPGSELPLPGKPQEGPKGVGIPLAARISMASPLDRPPPPHADHSAPCPAPQRHRPGRAPSLVPQVQDLAGTHGTGSRMTRVAQGVGGPFHIA